MGADQTTRWRDWPLIVLVIVLLPLLIPAILIWCLWLLVSKTLVLFAVWLLWLPRGKDTLIVYSRSPHWKEYFEVGVIPLLGRRALILNWSDRAKWPTIDLHVLVFRAFAGEREFNPIVIHFRPLHWPKRFRFFEPFKDHKHGKEQPLRDLERRLAQQFGMSIPAH